MLITKKEPSSFMRCKHDFVIPFGPPLNMKENPPLNTFKLYNLQIFVHLCKLYDRVAAKPVSKKCNTRKESVATLWIRQIEQFKSV